MYVEISTRQSGKTTRLVEAAVNYLRTNLTSLNERKSKIVICSFNQRQVRLIISKIRELLYSICSSEVRMEWPDDLVYRMVDTIYMPKVSFINQHLESDTCDYWFFDEFSHMPINEILHPITGQIITNAYYCTSPTESQSLDIIMNHCSENNYQPVFIDTYQNENQYIRNHVMREWYIFEGKYKKIGLISTRIKKHKLII